MSISERRSDVCSNDLGALRDAATMGPEPQSPAADGDPLWHHAGSAGPCGDAGHIAAEARFPVDRHQRSHPVPFCCRSLASSACGRSEEHTSELQSLMRISYAVFCLKKKTKKQNNQQHNNKPIT